MFSFLPHTRPSWRDALVITGRALSVERLGFCGEHPWSYAQQALFKAESAWCLGISYGVLERASDWFTLPVWSVTGTRNWALKCNRAWVGRVQRKVDCSRRMTLWHFALVASLRRLVQFLLLPLKRPGQNVIDTAGYYSPSKVISNSSVD